jgi:hypothetical protein
VIVSFYVPIAYVPISYKTPGQNYTMFEFLLRLCLGLYLVVYINILTAESAEIALKYRIPESLAHFKASSGTKPASWGS